MTAALVDSSPGLTTNVNPGDGVSDIRSPSGDNDGPTVAPSRIEAREEEIFVDLCDICSYSEKKQQRVKWCKWTEDKEEFSAILCKPCFISLQEINI